MRAKPLSSSPYPRHLFVLVWIIPFMAWALPRLTRLPRVLLRHMHRNVFTTAQRHSTVIKTAQ